MRGSSGGNGCAGPVPGLLALAGIRLKLLELFAHRRQGGLGGLLEELRLLGRRGARPHAEAMTFVQRQLMREPLDLGLAPHELAPCPTSRWRKASASVDRCRRAAAWSGHSSSMRALPRCASRRITNVRRREPPASAQSPAQPMAGVQRRAACEDSVARCRARASSGGPGWRSAVG